MRGFGIQLAWNKVPMSSGNPVRGFRFVETGLFQTILLFSERARPLSSYISNRFRASAENKRNYFCGLVSINRTPPNGGFCTKQNYEALGYYHVSLREKDVLK